MYVSIITLKISIIQNNSQEVLQIKITISNELLEEIPKKQKLQTNKNSIYYHIKMSVCKGLTSMDINYVMYYILL